MRLGVGAGCALSLLVGTLATAGEALDLEPEPSPEEELSGKLVKDPEAAGAIERVVWGDVDGDFAFTKADLEALSAALAKDDIDGLPCAQGGDVFPDAELDEADLERMGKALEEGIDGPSELISLGSLHCDTPLPLWVAASGSPGETIDLVMEGALSTKTVAVESIDAKVAIEAIGLSTYEIVLPDIDRDDVLFLLDTVLGSFWLDIGLRHDPPYMADEKDVGGGTPVMDIKYPYTGDCPHRGKGCCMLIVELHAASEMGNMGADLKKLEKDVTDAGACTVSSFYGEDHKLRDYPGTSDAAALTKWQADIKKAQAGLDAALKAHDTCITPEREEVIEIIKAHGTKATGGSDCGSWKSGPDLIDPNNGAYLEFGRSGHMKAWYNKVNKNVCSWSVSDFSCHSHNTVRLGDNLNNGLGGSCAPGPTPAAHGAHAGWEHDSSNSSGKFTYVWSATTNNDVRELAGNIGSALTTGTSITPWINQSNFRGHTSDAGWRTKPDGTTHICTPDPHPSTP
jgi:hypothetical protein